MIPTWTADIALTYMQTNVTENVNAREKAPSEY